MEHATKSNISFLYIDIEPHEDERFKVQKRMGELAGELFTSFCTFCFTPTRYIKIWKPECGQTRAATRVPAGVTRVYFFPVCDLCSRKDHTDQELQWKAIEQINTNVPLESGHRFFH